MCDVCYGKNAENILQPWAYAAVDSDSCKTVSYIGQLGADATKEFCPL